MGRLYLPDQVRSSDFREALRRSPLVITVGDRVTETAQKLGRTPDVQVVDGYERRKRRTPPDIPYVRLVKAPNPAGVITEAADSAVRSAVKGRKPARVLIDGEEDLLAIVAIDAAPLGSSVYYGQPGLGVVLVTVDERAKSSVGRILTPARVEKDGLD